MIPKILFMVMIAIIISSVIFIIIMFYITQNDLRQQNLEKNFFAELTSNQTQSSLEKNFYKNEISMSKNKIFLFGSSHINALNSTYINLNLESNGISDYTVYNLAFNSDYPSRRITTIDDIISTNPKLIVYGIDMRSFVEFEDFSGYENKILPDPQKNISEFSKTITKHFPYDTTFLSSPKLSLLKASRTLFQNDEHKTKEIEFSPYPNAPTVLITGENLISKTDEELKHVKTAETFNQLRKSEVNKEVIALKELIKKLEQNNIEIVIFTTPYHKFYLDSVKQSDIQSYEEIIRNIENETNVKIYRLDNQYDDMNCWSDLTHIAVNITSIPYNNDISNIILNEIKK